jgi:hypothetical protein
MRRYWLLFFAGVVVIACAMVVLMLNKFPSAREVGGFLGMVGTLWFCWWLISKIPIGHNKTPPDR